LKHISRTAALAFLIDLSEDNYLTAFDILYKELEAFSPELIKKQRLLVGTKTDLEGTQSRLEELKAGYPQERVLGVSVFSGEGIPELAARIGRLVNPGASADALIGDRAECGSVSDIPIGDSAEFGDRANPTIPKML
jgi:GTP-binding protein